MWQRRFHQSTSHCSGTRAYKAIRARVSRRHPSYRPVHHRDKAFIELFIPTPNMTQSDSGIITAMHDWSRNTRFHGKWGNCYREFIGVSCAASNTYKAHSHHGRARLQNSSSSTSIPHSTHAFFVMPVSGSSTLRPHSCSCWPFPIVSPNSPPPPLLAFL